ncbi:MAG: tetratricopeptide repeat protein [Verrucomicrobiales bacterium]
MTPSRSFIHLLLALCLLFGSARSQTPEELAQLDPSDVYFQAWLLVRDAEKLQEQKAYVKAFEKFRKASLFFNHLAVNYPSWKSELVQGRQRTTQDALNEIRDDAIAEQKKREKNFEGLVEDPSMGPPVAVPRDSPVPAEDEAGLAKLDQEIIQLKRQLTAAMNDRDANAARLRRTLTELEAQRRQAMNNSVKEEMEQLNRQIRALTRERDTLSTNLTQTAAQLRQARTELDSTRQELIASRQKEQELVKLMEEQRDVNFKVVKGQQAQLDALQKQMEEKDKLLSKADAHIRHLTEKLNASEALVGELRTERDGLLKERDQMSALLKINAADRVQELINQNVRLSRDLNEARERIKVLDEDTNATKDELIKAKRTLVVAKTRILRLQEENGAQKRRLGELSEKLKQANEDLLADGQREGLGEMAKAEIQTLREIIKKQQRSLQIQEEARDLLLAQAEREAANDEDWKQAVAQMKGTVVPKLTAEEEDIVASAGDSIEMTNRFRPSEAERRAAGNRLQQDKATYNRLARRAFGSERLPVARSFFETIISEDPGDWEAMMNLGIVLLRQEDPASAAEQFRQAILIKGEQSLPYAHFQLGVCYYRTELLDDSAQELETALKLDPENAKAHVFLGNISGRQNQLDKAENHFKKALGIDATLSEPHLNLAILRLRQGRKQEALGHYRDALKRGAQPHPALEAKLQTSPPSNAGANS